MRKRVVGQAFVDVPQKDLDSGVAPDTGTLDVGASRLLRIQSGPERPANSGSGVLSYSTVWH